MKPILFNTDMVRALLEGRKTCTRRVVKPQPKARLAYACMGYKHGTWGYPGPDAWKRWGESYRMPEGLSEDELKRHWNPPCHTDDILYVRETWCDPSGAGYPFLYKADMPMHWEAEDTEIGIPIDLRAEDYKWRPSIHMPREAARIFLRVTDVRVERLQDITEDGARLEGCFHGPLIDGCDFEVPALYSFQSVWDRTIKKSELETYGWAANPWVWVIEFERCEKSKEGTA